MDVRASAENDWSFDLEVSFEEGWLKARWQPTGFFIVPGRFGRVRWREVLQGMHRVLVALERS